ncbi:MAG: hypothetical protein HC838_15420 [Spirulinaceae cyanobacterium RM2_2_10]|nr:hypothetical protein [Spirulinaceae cyanobacterium RM2_2_10]
MAAQGTIDRQMRTVKIVGGSVSHAQLDHDAARSPMIQLVQGGGNEIPIQDR